MPGPALITSHGLRWAAVTAAVLLTGTACSGTNPGSTEAAAIAVLFHQDAGGGELESACSMLAPATVEKLEGKEPGSCARQLESLGLDEAARVIDARSFGNSAQVILEGDTVFLTRSGSGWKITAAGCAPRDERPYDCELEGN